MRVEFRHGIPDGCVEWLWANVGKGNLTRIDKKSTISGWDHIGIDTPEFSWFYKRETTQDVVDPTILHYAPTITVKDEKDAIIFALRWK